MPLLPLEMWSNIMRRVTAVHLMPRLAFHADTDLPYDLKGGARRSTFLRWHPRHTQWWMHDSGKRRRGSPRNDIAHCPPWYQPAGSCTSLELRPLQHLGTAPAQIHLADECPRAPPAGNVRSSGAQSDNLKDLGRAATPSHIINHNADRETSPLELGRVGGVLTWRPSTRRETKCAIPSEMDADCGSVSDVCDSSCAALSRDGPKSRGLSAVFA